MECYSWYVGPFLFRNPWQELKLKLEIHIMVTENVYESVHLHEMLRWDGEVLCNTVCIDITSFFLAVKSFLGWHILCSTIIHLNPPPFPKPPLPLEIRVISKNMAFQTPLEWHGMDISWINKHCNLYTAQLQVSFFQIHVKPCSDSNKKLYMQIVIM